MNQSGVDTADCDKAISVSSVIFTGIETPMKTLDEPEEQRKSKWFPQKVILIILFMVLTAVGLDLYLLNVSMCPKAVDIILSDSGPDAHIGLEAHMPASSLFSPVTFDYFECKVYHQREEPNDALTEKKIVTSLTSSDHFTSSSQVADMLSNHKSQSRVKVDIDMTNNDFTTIRQMLKDLYTKDVSSITSLSCSFDVNARILSFLPIKISDLKRNYNFPYDKIFPDSESNSESGGYASQKDGEIVGTMKTMWDGEKMKAALNSLFEESPDHIRSFDIDTQLTLHKYMDDMERFYIDVPSARYRIGAQEEDKSVESWTVETTAFTVDLVKKDTSNLKSTVRLGCTDGEKSGCELTDPASAVVRQGKSGHVSYAIAPASTFSSTDSEKFTVSSNYGGSDKSDHGNFLEELLGGNLEVEFDLDDTYPVNKLPDSRKLSRKDASGSRNIKIRFDLLGIIEHESYISFKYMIEGNGMEVDLVVDPSSGFGIGLYLALFNFKLGFEIYELELFSETIISSSNPDEAFYVFVLFPDGRNPLTTDGQHYVTVEATALEWLNDDNSTSFDITNDYSGASTDGKKCGSMSQNNVNGKVDYCFDKNLVEITLVDTDDEVFLTFGGHFSGSLGPTMADVDFDVVVYVTHEYDVTIVNPFSSTETDMPGTLEVSLHVELDEFKSYLRLDDLEGNEMLLVEGGTAWKDFYGFLNMGVRKSFFRVSIEEDEVFEWKLAKGEVRVLPDDDFLSLRAEGMKISLDGDELLGLSAGISVSLNDVDLLGRLALDGDEVVFGRFVAGWYFTSIYNFDVTLKKFVVRIDGEEIIAMEMAMVVEEDEDSYDNHMYMTMTCDLRLFEEQIIAVKNSEGDVIEASNFVNATGSADGILGNNEHFDGLIEVSFNKGDNSFDVIEMEMETTGLVITPAPSLAPTPYPHAMKTELKFLSKLTFKTSRAEFEADENAQQACIDAYKKVLDEPTADVSIGEITDISGFGSFSVADSRIKVEFITVLIKEKLTVVTDATEFYESLSETINAAVSDGDYAVLLEEAFIENDVVVTFESEETVELSELEVVVVESSSGDEGLSVAIIVVIVVVSVLAVSCFFIGCLFARRNKNKVGTA